MKPLVRVEPALSQSKASRWAASAQSQSSRGARSTHTTESRRAYTAVTHRHSIARAHRLQYSRPHEATTCHPSLILHLSPARSSELVVARQDSLAVEHSPPSPVVHTCRNSLPTARPPKRPPLSAYAGRCEPSPPLPPVRSSSPAPCHAVGTRLATALLRCLLCVSTFVRVLCSAETTL